MKQAPDSDVARSRFFFFFRWGWSVMKQAPGSDVAPEFFFPGGWSVMKQSSQGDVADAEFFFFFFTRAIAHSRDEAQISGSCGTFVGSGDGVTGTL